jgi:hypothetical protein
MPQAEAVTNNLYGMYRDVLRDAEGCVIWDGGWRKNTIVASCRQLLAAFMRGGAVTPPTLGIQGLQIGMGQPAWDSGPLPAPDPGRTALVDPHRFTVDLSHIKIDYLDGGTVTANPTNKLQIVATLGANIPSWPDVNHTTGTLREFGLVGQLGGALTPTLINYVAHPAIAKDPLSTLERTIWLTF